MKKRTAEGVCPQAVESSIYQMWMDGKCFHSNPMTAGSPLPFMPPPM